MTKKKSTWGGARNIKPYKTTVVRVPDPILINITKMITAFKKPNYKLPSGPGPDLILTDDQFKRAQKLAQQFTDEVLRVIDMTDEHRETLKIAWYEFFYEKIVSFANEDDLG